MKRIAAAVVCASCAAAATVWLALPPASAVPAFDDTKAAWCPSDRRLLDRRGEVLDVVRTDPHVRRFAWTSLDSTSPALVGAVLASEDRRFREHGGVDWRAVVAASWQRMTGGAPRGASTISMQVAAMLDATLKRGAQPRGALDKLAQMRAALQLEARWSKDEILEAYLNLVTFRGEVEGIGAAAGTMFSKSPESLSLEESAVLAASIRSPNATADRLGERARWLLAAMGADSARLDSAVAFVSGPAASRSARGGLAPHAARVLLRSGAGCDDVRSTLDAHVQSLASESLKRRLLELRDRSASDGAVLVVDNASGEVLAYVGSTGELSRAREVDGVRAARQAGSTLKPFLYGLAIERGLLTPATLLDDSPFEIAVGDTVYRPENYDHRFRGLVSTRTALASSLNIPAVRTAGLVGEDAFAQTLRGLGLSGVREDGAWYGPSLALGSVDVTLWDLVGAYRALARAGEWSPLTWGDAAKTRDAGNTRDTARDAADAGVRRGQSAHPRHVFDAATAWLVADMLSDRESRSATFQLESPLSTPFWTAVKTGTSKDMRDNWCVGFSDRFTVGVWVGNFSGEPMHDVSGTSGAAPVWREVTMALHEDRPAVRPAMPEGVVEAWTRLAQDAEPARREVYRRGTEPVSAETELDRHAKIAKPAEGVTIAIDPDIPSGRQRVTFEARSASDGVQWEIDDRPLGSATLPLLWEPAAGKHRLELVDASGRELDRVRFEVKAARAAAR